MVLVGILCGTRYKNLSTGHHFNNWTLKPVIIIRKECQRFELGPATMIPYSNCVWYYGLKHYQPSSLGCPLGLKWRLGPSSTSKVGDGHDSPGVKGLIQFLFLGGRWWAQWPSMLKYKSTCSILGVDVTRLEFDNVEYCHTNYIIIMSASN